MVNSVQCAAQQPQSSTEEKITLATLLVNTRPGIGYRTRHFPRFRRHRLRLRDRLPRFLTARELWCPRIYQCDRQCLHCLAKLTGSAK